MSAPQSQRRMPHERELTEEEKRKVEDATTYERFLGVVYKFKGERKIYWGDRVKGQR